MVRLENIRGLIDLSKLEKMKERATEDGVIEEIDQLRMNQDPEMEGVDHPLALEGMEIHLSKEGIETGVIGVLSAEVAGVIMPRPTTSRVVPARVVQTFISKP